MRAIRFRDYGGPSVLALEEVPTPRPGLGEVLVKVSAAGINRSDVAAVAGAFKSKTPRVPGRDFAGVVERIPTLALKYGAASEARGATATVHVRNL
jgi:NADPH2:quinone reductase